LRCRGVRIATRPIPFAACLQRDLATVITVYVQSSGGASNIASILEEVAA
jgi:hypothetical protein